MKFLFSILAILFSFNFTLLSAEKYIESEIESKIESARKNGIYATFNIYAEKSSHLSLASSGVVEKISAEIGQKVKKNQVLLNLQNQDLQEALKAQKAALEAINARYNFSKAQLERYEKSRDVLDKNTIEKIESEHKAITATLQQAQAQYSLQKEQLSKSILKAPFSGIITEKNIEVGDGVAGISSKLFTLESEQKKAILNFDSKHLSQIKKDAIFFARIDGNFLNIKLKINKIYPSINPQTKKAQAEVLIPLDLSKEIKELLKSGVFGDGWIEKMD